MRHMLFMHPNTSRIGDDWSGPSAEEAAEMGRFNEQLVQAGVLLAADGLHPPTTGARVRGAGAGAENVVTPGPFPEATDVIGGYWTIDVRDTDEAIAWAAKCPLGEGDMIEVRRVYEMSDFPEDVQAAAELSSVPPEQTSAQA